MIKPHDVVGRSTHSFTGISDTHAAPTRPKVATWALYIANVSMSGSEILNETYSCISRWLKFVSLRRETNLIQL